MFRREMAAALLCACLLPGCSLSGLVGSSSVEYNHAIEDVTNQLIVTNILRARDHVPLHFTDLSLIHGSLQIAANGNGALPFGEVGRSTTRPRDLLTLAASISSSPAFDTSPLNSSGFTAGLLAPIPFKYLRYYLDQGISQRLLLNLFVEKVALTRFGPPPELCVYENTTKPVMTVQNSDALPACPPPGYGNVHSFQDLVRQWGKPILINDYEQLAPYGPPLKLGGPDTIRDLAAASTSNLNLRRLPDGSYQLFKSTSHTAVCTPSGAEYVASDIASEPVSGQNHVAINEACYRRQIQAAEPAGADTVPASVGRGRGREAKPDQLQVTITMRTVKGLIEYLGELSGLPAGVDRPIPFFIQSGPGVGARMNVGYDGVVYHIDTYRQGSDETVQILSIVNDMLDLIKKANEIPNTPAVQVLQ